MLCLFCFNVFNFDKKEMISQKKIDINQSSLLGLKAELERKKREVESVKSKQFVRDLKIKVATKPKHNKKECKPVKEGGKTLAEADLLDKSKKILEAKVKTYELLCENERLGESEIDSSEFLVNFKLKKEKEKESSDQLYPDESDEEWIDYVDCLGRTKRCHRDDFQAAKEQDEMLKTNLFRKSDANEEKNVSPDPREIFPKDANKEEMRGKWEEQEQILLDKKEIHYQDILFNEARSHGVGYYEFSTDGKERHRQQEELKRSREETLQRQALARDIAEKKKNQIQERRNAAKKRKRERLGLPPEENIILNERDNDNASEKGGESSKDVESPRKRQNSEPGLNIEKPVSARPWDWGKKGVPKVLSQEEWVEKKRSERILEFAPPSKLGKNYKELKKEEKKLTKKTREGVQIPPPDFYSTCSKNTSPNIEKSIEEGLKFLRDQADRERGNPKTGIFDFN